jgi:hypothetical protein
VPMASLRDISRLRVDKIYLERRLSSPGDRPRSLLSKGLSGRWWWS